MNWDSRFLILSYHYITTTNQHSINIHRNVVPPGQLPGQMMRPGGPPGGGGPQVPTSQPPPGPGGKMPGSIKTNIRAANQVHPYAR